MTVWAQIFLGVIAIATLTTAIVQLGVLIAAGRVARRVNRLMDQIENELAPTFGHLNAIGRDASRAVALATAQIERLDLLLTDVTRRVEETFQAVQKTILRPARGGIAVWTAMRAAMDVVRAARRNPRGRQRSEDEDALFI